MVLRQTRKSLNLGLNEEFSVKPEIQIHLFGSLRQMVEDPTDLPIRLGHDAPMPMDDVLSRCGFPPNRIQLVMVNHRAVSRDVKIHPGDRLALFPGEYPFFPDWKDFRLAKP